MVCVAALGIAGGGSRGAFTGSGAAVRSRAQPPQNLSDGWLIAPQGLHAPASAPPQAPQKLRQGSFRRRHFEPAMRWIVRDMPDESATSEKDEGRSGLLTRFAHNEPDRSTVRLSIPYAYA